MAGQNHQRTTLYNIMILSCHDSVSLGCGWPRCEISRLGAMPFGNSWLDKCEGHRFFPVLILQESGPAADWLAYFAWTGTQPAFGSKVSACLFIEALGQLLFLRLAQQIVAQCQHQPQRAEQFQQLDEAHAQNGHLSSRRPISLLCQQCRDRAAAGQVPVVTVWDCKSPLRRNRSEEHTSEL